MDKFEQALLETEKFMATIKADPAYEAEARAFDEEYEIAEVLASARQRARLSQAELAKRMKTTQSTISLIESGRANVSVAKLRKYAASCGGRLKVNIVF